jgi:hypothetical protein|tara:strand:- start:839 stop:1084 length:246 start_codon:yes stop_codon:yes gene_type:complete
MINGKEFIKQLSRFVESPVCKDARVQVKLPRGEYKSPDGFFDIKSIYLLQNNLIGARETHRIVLEISTTESWKMGKPKLKL